MADKLRILVPRIRPTTNPYLIMLRAAVETHPDVLVLDFSWRRALLGDYDVYHVHWPEVLLTGRTRVRTAVREALFFALLVRLGLTRSALVRTLHNIDLPSGMTAGQLRLLRAAQRAADVWIVLNTVSAAPDGARAVFVPHGHYRDWFASYPQPTVVPGRIAFFGLIRRYKGVGALMRAFRELPDPDDRLSLSVSGKPSLPELADELRDLAGGDTRVVLNLHFLSDAEIVEAVGAAQLVVLPYREMHNSGGVLTALSLDRPVLVPDNEVNRRLADEVGHGWVLRYQGELTARDLLTALDLTEHLGKGQRPDLSGRQWDECGAAHVAAYREARLVARATGVRRRLRRIFSSS